MATLTVQNVSKAGLADLSGALAAADAAGDQVAAAGGLLLVVENGDASSHTVTVARPSATANVGGYGDLAVADLTLTVAAGDIGFLTIPSKYADGSNFAWTYDAVTSLGVGVFSLAP